MTGDNRTPAERRAALAADRAAARSERRHRERTIGAKGTAVSYAFAGVMLVAAMLLALLATRGVLPEGEAGHWIASAVVLTLFCVGYVAILRWQVARRDSVPPVEANAVHVARSVAPVAQPSLEQQEREARLARFAEQRVTSVLWSEQAVPQNELFWGAVFGGPALLAGLIIPFAEPLGEQPLLACGFYAALALAAGILIALRRRRVGRLARRRQAFGLLAAKLEHGELLDHRGAVSWLNAFWPEASTPQDLHTSPGELAISGKLHGFPVLIDVEPEGGRADEYVSYPPRAVAYVAALLPARFARGAGAEELRALLTRDGYVLECHAGAGLMARASDLALEPLLADPPMVTSVLTITERLANAARASKIAPAPLT